MMKTNLSHILNLISSPIKQPYINSTTKAINEIYNQDRKIFHEWKSTQVIYGVCQKIRKRTLLSLYSYRKYVVVFILYNKSKNEISRLLLDIVINIESWDNLGLAFQFRILFRRRQLLASTSTFYISYKK